MKQIKVFSNRKTKRIVPGISLRNLGTVLLFLLLIPYLITFLFQNLGQESEKDQITASVENELTSSLYQVVNDTGMGRETIPLEWYVADKLVRTMNPSWEKEALKAQAVLIRSGLYARLEEKGTEDVLAVEDESYGSVPVTEIVREAVAETAGLCMAYQGQIVPGAYFAVSNGATRDGSESGYTEYPYLKSVFCNRDFLAEDYNYSVSFSVDEFERIWEKLPEAEENAETAKENTEAAEENTEAAEEEFACRRDSVGYVLLVKWKGKYVSGEALRFALHIPSASFRISKEEKQVSIAAKGVGHGFGMSQFGANEMAKEGKTATEILEYFFQDVTITKIE